MKNLTVVIPVRQGSQRIKNKNFREFAGKSLLEHKIDIVKKLPVNNIIINTDSEYAIELAKKSNIQYYRRESYYASSDCSGSEYMEYLAKVTDVENMLITPVTAPLITVDTFIEAIDIYNNVNCNSLMSIKKIKEYLWYKNKPINYKLDYAPNSQDLPDYFSPTFGVIIVNREAMLKSKNFICSKPNFYELSDIEAMDIDTKLDFDLAEYLFKKRNNE